MYRDCRLPPGTSMLVLGIETSCDETGLAVYDTARGACSRMRCTRRWRCTRSTAASCPSSPRAITSGAWSRSRSASLADAGRSARRSRRHRLHARARPRRRAAGRRERGERARLRARQAGDRRPSPGRPPALAAARRTRSRRFRSSPCSSRAGTASCSKSKASGATVCSATPRTTPRARRSTRPRNCWASAIPADRRSRGSRSRVATARYRCRARCSRAAIST